jgi:hypothetical protein
VDEARAAVLRLSESDELALSFAPGLGWHPVRHLLGITAFDMNAYTCHADGGPLVEEHDELGDTAGGHEEAYVVIAGHAVFTLDGEEVDKWEYAFRADAESHRGRPLEGVTILEEALQRWPDDPILLYNLACFESLGGRGGEALTHLRRAVELEPMYVGYAADDGKVDAFRGELGFPLPPG